MNIDLHLLPYDSGRRNWRMGNGPEHFVQNGLEQYLAARGHTVQTNRIEAQNPFPSEIQTAFELYGKLAEAVNTSRRADAFSVVLSGNCGAAVGTTAGISERPVGIIWLDAHGDFNTPETTASGFLDGMGLAIAAGLCWKKLAQKIPHYQPIRGGCMIHVGGSDIEQDEQSLMVQNEVTVLPLASLRAGEIAPLLLPALDRLRGEVQEVYLHLDLDVLDPIKTRANHFPSSVGLEVAQAKEIIRLIRERLLLRAMGVASYDPAFDPQGNTLRAGIELIAEAVQGKA